MEGAQRKWVGGLSALLVVIGVGVWELGIKASIERNAAWQGELIEVESSRRWWRGFRKPGEAAYRYYTYYWRVRLDDGSEKRVRIPFSMKGRATPGTPVRKVKGDRWPVVDTPEAERGRQIVDQVIGDVWNSVAP